MATLKRKLLLLLLPLTFPCFGCQITYITKSAIGQFQLLNSKVPFEKALQDPSLTAEVKRKISLANEARLFAETDLKLTPTKNYSSFVKLDRPYVTYVVSASQKWELKQHDFNFLVIGKMPYKGYFSEADAKNEELDLQKLDLDTYQRGVTAYSTLGWFEDPLLSSMLSYSEEDLVNTIIHETVHSTIYVKNNADFNERLAVFLGNRGAEAFYLKKEGPTSAVLKKIQESNEDEKVFSKFIGKELNDLTKWYLALQPNLRTIDLRKKRIEEIKVRFYSEVFPLLKSRSHFGFNKGELNNARLLVYKTYLQDLHLFEELFVLCENNYQLFIEKIKTLEKSKSPEKDLALMIKNK